MHPMRPVRELSTHVVLAAVAASLVSVAVTTAAVTTIAAFRAPLAHSAEAAPQPGPAGDGDVIALHGEWVIEVHDPDGRTVSRTEFTNDLTPDGRAALIELLVGRAHTDHWRLVLSGTAFCGISGQCVAQEARFPAPEAGNLYLELRSAGHGFGLRGYVGVTRDGQLTSVASWLDTCTLQELRGGTGGISPWGTRRLCALEDDWVTATRTARPFTQTAIPHPVAVTAGQLVAVDVNFTFSGTTRRDPLPAAAAAGAAVSGTTPPGAPAFAPLLP